MWQYVSCMLWLYAMFSAPSADKSGAAVHRQARELTGWPSHPPPCWPSGPCCVILWVQVIGASRPLVEQVVRELAARQCGSKLELRGKARAEGLQWDESRKAVTGAVGQ